MKTFIKMLMALGLVAVLTACGGSSNGATDENQTTQTNCQAKVFFANSEGVQVEATCTNASNIDLDGSAGNLAPYIQINELQVQLTADEIISNDGNTVVWHKIVYPLPSSLNVMAYIVVYASNEAGDFVKVVSPDFSVQTAAAPKPAPATPEPVTPDPEPISTPTITMANQTVNDDGGGFANPVGTPTVTGVNAGAVYSLTANPYGTMLTIDSSTGAMTWQGDLGSNQTETISVKVLNTDGGTDTTTFSLTVIDNG